MKRSFGYFAAEGLREIPVPSLPVEVAMPRVFAEDHEIDRCNDSGTRVSESKRLIRYSVETAEQWENWVSDAAYYASESRYMWPARYDLERSAIAAFSRLETVSERNQ